MAQRIYVTLYLLGDPDELAGPLRYQGEEGHQYTHRIAIYRPQELLLGSRLDFVGFVSSKRNPGNAQVIEEIQAVDKKLGDELIHIPGLLSYSSLELRDGRWCNLVLFNEAAAKIHIKRSATHAYAAYELAPRYYDWVNIHTGIMPAGLAGNELLLQKTRYYLFYGAQQKPTTREVTYKEAL